MLSATLEPICEALSVVLRPRADARRVVITNSSRNPSQEALESNIKKMLAEV